MKRASRLISILVALTLPVFFMAGLEASAAPKQQQQVQQDQAGQKATTKKAKKAKKAKKGKKAKKAATSGMMN
ncbi:MAG: hypothetical protein G8345_06745 [Magnetococcales bacterium]|nr:hypothetical protein [Magnetococcales bacterium]NGZ26569.1 hypothetical protein [Magnetococcales bacterium]